MECRDSSCCCPLDTCTADMNSTDCAELQMLSCPHLGSQLEVLPKQEAEEVHIT